MLILPQFNVRRIIVVKRDNEKRERERERERERKGESESGRERDRDREMERREREREREGLRQTDGGWREVRGRDGRTYGLTN